MPIYCNSAYSVQAMCLLLMYEHYWPIEHVLVKVIKIFRCAEFVPCSCHMLQQ